MCDIATSSLDSPGPSTGSDAEGNSETPRSCYEAEWTKRKRKVDMVDASFVELASALKTQISQTISATSQTDADEIFGNFVGAELKQKSDIAKKELKKQIINLLCSID